MNRPRTLEHTDYVPFERYLLEISYDGGCYAGWQIQPHCETVQEAVQKTLSRLYADYPIHVLGASRTDAGVHALGFAASFLVPERPYIPPDKLQGILNRLLPPSVRIRGVSKVALDFHARYDAVGKAYTYVFNRGTETPFSNRYSWKCRYELDFDAMLEASRHLLGTHDFSSFVVERKTVEDAVRTIHEIDRNDFGNYVCFTFKGTGFLYKMVRCLTGALEAVGYGKIGVDDVRAILEAKDRNLAPETAPPHGLFLMKTFFNEKDYFGFKLEKVPFYY